MYNKQSENIKIKILYTPGSAFLELSYFRTFLVLKLVPWLRTNDKGVDQYCKNTFVSTTLNPDGAAYFHDFAMAIIDGKEYAKEFPAVLPCKNGTTITLAYGAATAYLYIKKNNSNVCFEFKAQGIQEFVNGQQVTKIIQTDLEEFAWLLNGYIQKCGAEHLLKKPAVEISNV